MAVGVVVECDVLLMPLLMYQISAALFDVLWRRVISSDGDGGALIVRGGDGGG